MRGIIADLCKRYSKTGMLLFMVGLFGAFFAGGFIVSFAGAETENKPVEDILLSIGSLAAIAGGVWYMFYVICRQGVAPCQEKVQVKRGFSSESAYSTFHD